MTKKIILIILIAVAALLMFWFTRKPAAAPESGSTVMPVQTASPTPQSGSLIEAQKGTLQNLEDKSAAAESVTIDMTARQWTFEPATVRVPFGAEVTLRIHSIDVKHGIRIADFGVDEDLEVGQTVEARFTADRQGSFTFFCDVFCGSGHRDMKGTLIVE